LFSNISKNFNTGGSIAELCGEPILLGDCCSWSLWRRSLPWNYEEDRGGGHLRIIAGANTKLFFAIYSSLNTELRLCRNRKQRVSRTAAKVHLF